MWTCSLSTVSLLLSFRSRFNIHLIQLTWTNGKGEEWENGHLTLIVFRTSVDLSINQFIIVAMFIDLRRCTLMISYWTNRIRRARISFQSDADLLLSLIDAHRIRMFVREQARRRSSWAHHQCQCVSVCLGEETFISACELRWTWSRRRRRGKCPSSFLT